MNYCCLGRSHCSTAEFSAVAANKRVFHNSKCTRTRFIYSFTLFRRAHFQLRAVLIIRIYSTRFSVSVFAILISRYLCSLVLGIRQMNYLVCFLLLIKLILKQQWTYLLHKSLNTIYDQNNIYIEYAVGCTLHTFKKKLFALLCRVRTE